jgi:DNA-binding CsgD family transcriptional regulator
MDRPLPAIRTRPLRPSDSTIAASWMVAEWSFPRETVGAFAALFASLMAEERIRGVCVEQLEHGQSEWTMAALGLSAFVPEAEIDAYLASPMPYPSLLLLQKARDGDRGVFLDDGAIARANAGPGLNQMTLYYGQITKDPSDPRWRPLLAASHKMHREHHGGYRMRRLLQDEWTRNEDVFVYAGYRALRRFPVGTRCPMGLAPLSAPRSLVGLTAAEAAAQLPGTTASLLFEFREPRLALTASERRLLAHAASGMTDSEITRALALSPNTLKATWRQIYGRIEDRAPFVLRHEGATGPTNRRGIEKRRHVVNYIADNPQELRPYAEMQEARV